MIIDFERNIKLFGNTFNNFLSENTLLESYQERMYFTNLSEAEKFTVSDKLIAALYKSAMDKYVIIDFGDIPNSKGDIDRIAHISDINDTIDIIGQIAPNMPELQVVKDTMNILRTYKKEFSLGFIQDVPMIVMTYNTTVLSLFVAISLSMNICLDYLRTPDGSIQTSSDIMYKSNKQYNVVIDNLTKLNLASQKGDLKKLFDACLKKDSFIGTGFGLGVALPSVATGAIIGVAVVAVAISIIPVVRELIYFAYNFRMNISEFFKKQSEFLEINVTELRAENNSKNNSVIKRQEHRIKQLQNIANKFEIQFNSANEKTRKDLQSKISTNNIQSSLVSDKDDISAFSLV